MNEVKDPKLNELRNKGGKGNGKGNDRNGGGNPPASGGTCPAGLTSTGINLDKDICKFYHGTNGGPGCSFGQLCQWKHSVAEKSESSFCKQCGEPGHNAGVGGVQCPTISDITKKIITKNPMATSKNRPPSKGKGKGKGKGRMNQLVSSDTSPTDPTPVPKIQEIRTTLADPFHNESPGP